MVKKAKMMLNQMLTILLMLVLMLMILPRTRDKLAWLRPLAIVVRQVSPFDAE